MSSEPVYGFWPKLHRYIVGKRGKSWFDLGDLDLIFKVTPALWNVQNKVFLRCTLNQWKDFDQTCIDTLLEGRAGRCHVYEIWLTFTRVPVTETIPFTRNFQTDFFPVCSSVKSPIFSLKKALKNVPQKLFLVRCCDRTCFKYGVNGKRLHHAQTRTLRTFSSVASV